MNAVLTSIASFSRSLLPNFSVLLDFSPLKFLKIFLFDVLGPGVVRFSFLSWWAVASASNWFLSFGLRFSLSFFLLKTIYVITNHIHGNGTFLFFLLLFYLGRLFCMHDMI